MRVVTQLVLVAVVAAAAGGYYYFSGQAGGAQATAAAGRSGAAPRTVQVLTAPAKVGRIEQKMEAVGTARSNEAITVTAKDAGRVSVIHFTEGAYVEKGALLLEQDSSERRADMEQARSQRESARASREDVKVRLDRAKQLRATGNVTEARLDELEAQYRAADALFNAAEARLRATEARLADMKVTAPFAGRVGLRLVSPGALVQPGTAVTTLDDVAKIKVEFALPEVAMGQIRPGLPITATAAAYADRAFAGTISVIDTRIDPVTRSFRVNAEFDNRDEILRPGMFLAIGLTLSAKENAVLVPEEAVVPLGSSMFVFVVADGRAERREVTLGIRRQGEIEILSGVAGGEQVVVQGVQKVRDKQPVQVIRPAGPATS
ncbi:MAG: efflux RND transporter periplasmic adaptor subunit [Thalassobaculales bacterium]